MNSCTLVVTLRDYWHAGGGRGGGAVLDDIVHRDNDGLPLLPGRHVKGLLRDALATADALQWPGYGNLDKKLFGTRTEENGQPSVPGLLRVSDAVLPNVVSAWLRGESGKMHLRHLFHSLHITAVEHATGAAKDKSLRSLEVVVPLCLRAQINTVSTAQVPPNDWADLLQDALPLIDSVGAHRSRGLGRAVLTLEDSH